MCAHDPASARWSGASRALLRAAALRAARTPALAMDAQKQRVAELEAELAALKRYLHAWHIPFPNDGIDRRFGVPRSVRTPLYDGPLTTIQVLADPNRTMHG